LADRLESLMRFLALVLAGSVLAMGATLADEDPSPMKPEEAAKAIETAHVAGDQVALERLAKPAAPDRWIVADELCHRGSSEAARAFVAAMPHPDGKKLRAYIDAWKSDKPDRELLDSLNTALEDEYWDTVVIGTTKLSGTPTSVVRIRLWHARGRALAELKQFEQSTVVLKQAAKAAEDLGWSERAEQLMAEAYWAIRDLYESGEDHHRRGDMKSAHAEYTTAFRLMDGLENKHPDLLTEIMGNLGTVQLQRGMLEDALESFERVEKLTEANSLQHAWILNKLGTVQQQSDVPNAYDLAKQSFEAAKKVAEALQEDGKIELAKTAGHFGSWHLARGEYESALKAYSDAKLALEDLAYESKDDEKSLRSIRAQIAGMLNNIGKAYQTLGDYDQAKTNYESAHDLKTGLGDRAGAAMTLGNLGNLYRTSGEYSLALRTLGRALSALKPLGREAAVAMVHGYIGNVYQRTGDYQRALENLEIAGEVLERLGYGTAAAEMLLNIGNAQKYLADHGEEQADYAKALETYKKALKAMQGLQNKVGEAQAHGNIGVVRHARHEFGQAISAYKEAIKAHKQASETYQQAAREGRSIKDDDLDKIEDTVGAAMARANLGEVYQHDGQLKNALVELQKSVRVFESKKARPQLVAAQSMLARLHLERAEVPDRYDRSLKLSEAYNKAEKALKVLKDKLLAKLDDEQGVAAREHHASLFAIGALAALRQYFDPATTDKNVYVERAWDFMENGRAGALLSVLGGEGRVATLRRRKDIDESYIKEHEEAKKRVNDAQDEYDRATPRSSERADAKKRLDQATEDMLAAWAAMQREIIAKANSDQQVVTLSSVRAALRTGQVLVLYSLFEDDWGIDEAFALILSKEEDARVVKLGKASELEELCATLTIRDDSSPLARSQARGGFAGDQHFEEEEELKQDWTRSIKRVQAAVIEPLGLDENTTTRVLVSPEGALCYVPFGALYQVPVTLTPSGTTHVVLSQKANRNSEKGREILALGDPVYTWKSEEGAQEIYYRGSTLDRLPKTGPEATAIGTSKEVVLLREQASETSLIAALKRKTLLPPSRRRWRAVHFACHGLLDGDHPMLSSLALSRTSEDDGFLTAHEVLDLDLPADLVVLSACQTAQGKILRGEGIAGFTRAFMFAGAPRVICSLWDVDDAATAELMKKFYELWNPKEGKGLDACVALQKAQEYIRDHENGKWKSPYYWAAWVLWGLPN
jgi:CHAT domain-containing protein